MTKNYYRKARYYLLIFLILAVSIIYSFCTHQVLQTSTNNAPSKTIIEVVRISYGFLFLLVSLFFISFILAVKRQAPQGIDEVHSGMDRREKIFLVSFIIVVIALHFLTLSNVIPWQEWRLWKNVNVDKVVKINVKNYDFSLPEKPISIQKEIFVKFILTSEDVTYGFGVFRKDGSMVFQFTVLPNYQNCFVWKFTEHGFYDIRSTEYSGPKHSQMKVENAIIVNNDK